MGEIEVGLGKKIRWNNRFRKIEKFPHEHFEEFESSGTKNLGESKL